METHSETRGFRPRYSSKACFHTDRSDRKVDPYYSYLNLYNRLAGLITKQIS